MPYHALACLLTLLLACDAPERSREPETRPPNIVLIFTDDQGYADVSCQGAKGFATPHLDRLAAEGARFTRFYVAQPVCSASRAALLTGCYPNRVGIWGALGPNSEHALDTAETTIAAMLRAHGYAAACFGKWHLGDTPDFLPLRFGFDEYFGIPYSNDMWPRHPWQGTVFDFPPLPLIEGEARIDTLEEQSMLTTWITERAVDFIAREKDQPFFLYVPHPMPHVPLFVSDKFAGKTEAGIYGDVIEEIDWSVGQILRALDEHGLRDHTWVIFTSDNGPWLSYGAHAGSAAPLREGKGTVWEGGVRVPAIMRWPGRIPAGLVVDEPAMTIDLLPTIARVTGASLPSRPIDGRDIWPIIAGEPRAKNPHEAYFFYYHRNQLQAVMSGEWKLYLPHRYASLRGQPGGAGGLPAPYQQMELESPELYHLLDDAGERHNLADRHPEIVARLLELAEKARVDLGDELAGREGSGRRRE
jgi:arylsulfatase A